MEAKTTTGIAISVGVAILLGVILIQIIADQTVSKVQLVPQTDTFTLVRQGATTHINETYVYRLSKVDDAWRADISECSKAKIIDPTSGTTGNLRLYNSSGGIIDNGEEYIVVTGVNSVKFKDADDINGTGTTATATYRTCPTEYVSGWGSTIVRLVPGFFAIAILLGAAFVIFYILKREGVDLGI